ncbi:hypothetical protein JW998_06410 [candidate division KSB1 bacterium]|nr:hypothetical protein [candidate division KSB1 bacterium]
MPEKNGLLKLIHWHLRSHQHLSIQDVYKLLYQGVFGAEHLLKDAARARSALEDEWQKLDEGAVESLLELVSADGAIVRANLQPCKTAGLSSERLWQIILRSAAQVNGSAGEFEAIWRQFEELCAEGELPFATDSVTQFGRAAKKHGWPAQHHSQRYRQANSPAYRVLLHREFARYVAASPIMNQMENR